MGGIVRVVLMATVVVSCAGVARAEDKAKAREAFEAATRHYDLTEYRDALASFKEAYRNFPDPSFLFNIGQCYRQLGDKEQAVRFFRNYLSKVPNAPNRESVRAMISHLEQLSEEERRTQAAPPVGTMRPNEPNAPATAEPATTVSPLTATTVTATGAPRARTPIYKKWWLWTAVGVVAVGVAVGLGVGLSGSSSQKADTSFGTLHPF